MTEIDFNDLFSLGLGLFSAAEAERRSKKKNIHNKKTDALKLMELERQQHKRNQQLAFQAWCKPGEWYPPPVFMDAEFETI